MDTSRESWQPKPTDRERFEKRVDRSGGEDACHLWTGSTYEFGYGSFWINGHTTTAHRVAWMLANGPISDYLQVRHLVCNRPLCVNIKHLALGSHAQNMADKKLHHTNSNGERSGLAILTQEMIQEGANLRRAGWTWKRIATHLGVARTTIARAIKHTNGAWEDVDTGYFPTRLSGLEPDVVEEAIQLKQQGLTYAEIGRRMGIHRVLVRKAILKTGRITPDHHWEKQLNDDIVLRAYEMHRNGERWTDIARTFGVKMTTIRSAVLQEGGKWRHLDMKDVHVRHRKGTPS